ncbi:hypothetical protein ANCDUO_05287 [Ancylostoma duodenale]|uniref:Secreted protein n=1 Tax=Ancylostoma duodenale TaxID=51022 RepID=A0A0C2D4J4_9BILA|nr:hypothetical protein ANCDUO_05287 [Ancylostoma duodenale]
MLWYIFSGIFTLFIFLIFQLDSNQMERTMVLTTKTTSACTSAQDWHQQATSKCAIQTLPLILDDNKHARADACVRASISRTRP